MGTVRPAAAWRRVLRAAANCPPPHLSPPGISGHLRGVGFGGGKGRGGEGNPEPCRRTTISLKVERPGAGTVRFAPHGSGDHREKLPASGGGVPGFFGPFRKRLFYEPFNRGSEKPGLFRPAFTGAFHTAGTCGTKKGGVDELGKLRSGGGVEQF